MCLQVAETFEMELEGTSLKDVSKLDTCVTVVDASNLDVNLKSIQKVKVCPFPSMPLLATVGVKM